MALLALGPCEEEEDLWQPYVDAARSGWLAKWQNHCRICYGDPGEPDPSTELLVGICTECTPAGTCPRCGSQMAAPHESCPSCQWERKLDADWTENSNQCPW